MYNVGDNMVTNLDSDVPATLMTKLKEGCSIRSGNGSVLEVSNTGGIDVNTVLS